MVSKNSKSRTLARVDVYYIDVDGKHYAMFLVNESRRVIRFFKRVQGDSLIQVRDTEEVRRLSDAVDREWGTVSVHESQAPLMPQEPGRA